MLPQKPGRPKSAQAIPAQFGGKNCIRRFFSAPSAGGLPPRLHFCYGAVNIYF
jgi:hypothetical protein